MLPALALPALSTLTAPTSATSSAASGAGAGAGAGSITFGETKTNWTTIALIGGLALVALVLAKKAA